MILVVSVRRKTFQNPARDVYGRGIKHGIVIGERHVLKHHAVIILVERSPGPVARAHGAAPGDGVGNRLRHLLRVAGLEQRRPAHAENTLARIHAWRRECPQLTLRSTFIVGFPGETEEEFAELLSWLDEAQLDRVGCFKYSPVEGAAANALASPVPEAVKEERYARFMSKAGEISARRLKARIGERMQVLVDTIDGRSAIARGPGDAPQIDGVVHIGAAGGLRVGEFAEVKITGADTYDLKASVIRP